MIMVTERVLDGIMGYGSYRVDTKHLEHIRLQLASPGQSTQQERLPLRGP